MARDFGGLTFATRERFVFKTDQATVDFGGLTFATRYRWALAGAVGGAPVSAAYYQSLLRANRQGRAA